MRYLKLFESFNKEDIDFICEIYDITNYTINEDGTIDVDGNVSLQFYRQGLTELPLRFRNVTGHFYCHNSQLASLDGSPKTVGGGFYCHNNQLASLVGSPQSVGGDFFCYSNQLISLDGCPQSVGGHFHCSGNPCSSIYIDWINSDRKEELMDMMKDYDFLRDDTINWYLLESFFNDAGLLVPSRSLLEKYYTIKE